MRTEFSGEAAEVSGTVELDEESLSDREDTVDNLDTVSLNAAGEEE